jgi:hypothetical protein
MGFLNLLILNTQEKVLTLVVPLTTKELSVVIITDVLLIIESLVVKANAVTIEIKNIILLIIITLKLNFWNLIINSFKLFTIG